MKPTVILAIAIIICAGCATMESEFRKACDDNTIAGYERYLEKYPGSQFETDARNRMEALEWAKAVDDKSIWGYEAYLHKYPQGKYQDDAKRQLGDAKWERIKANSNVTSRERYDAAKNYIEQQPTGAYALEARITLRDLEKIVSEEVKREAAFREKLKTASSTEELESVVRQYVDLKAVGEAIVQAETSIISQIQKNGPGGRFAISSIVPSTKIPGLENERLCFMGDEKQGVRIGGLYPGDGGVTMRVVVADGKQLTLPGGVWRFIGKVGIGNHVFEGENEAGHVLTFFLTAEHGLVYVRGAGKVTLPSGQVLNLGKK